MMIVRAKNFLINIKRMPGRIKRIFEMLEHLSKASTPKLDNFNIMQKQIAAIFDLIVLKEINPSIVKSLIPEMPATDDILTFDVNRRLQKEKNIDIISNAAATVINKLVSGCPSLSYHQRIEYARTALDTASFDLKPRFVSYLMKHPLYFARDLEKAIQYGRMFESFDRKIIWKPEYRDAWQAYIAALLAAGEKNHAFMMLLHYERAFGLGGVEVTPGLAYFASKQGLNTPEIEQSAFIYQKFLDGSDRLREYLQENCGSIAVVGSGPYELGKRKGKEIDSYSIVARTPQIINSDLAKDYGRKRDIVILTTLWQIPLEHIINYSPYILVPFTLDTYCTSKDFRKYLFSALKNNNDIILADMPSAVRVKITADSAAYNIGSNFSTGARALYCFKDVLAENLTSENIYGFSFTNTEIDDFSWNRIYRFDIAQYSHIPSSSLHIGGHAHNFIQERKVLRSLFSLPE